MLVVHAICKDKGYHTLQALKGRISIFIAFRKSSKSVIAMFRNSSSLTGRGINLWSMPTGSKKPLLLESPVEPKTETGVCDGNGICRFWDEMGISESPFGCRPSVSRFSSVQGSNTDPMSFSLKSDLALVRQNIHRRTYAMSGHTSSNWLNTGCFLETYRK